VTLNELEDALPNGFHDALLVGLSVDFMAASCILELDADFDDPDPNLYQR
jgi:hypothetical protein